MDLPSKPDFLIQSRVQSNKTKINELAEYNLQHNGETFIANFTNIQRVKAQQLAHSYAGAVHPYGVQIISRNPQTGEALGWRKIHGYSVWIPTPP